MLQSLIQKAQYAAIRRAFQKRKLRCPGCHTVATSLPASADSVVHCLNCNQDSLAPEWLPSATPQLAADPDRIPANTRIKRRQEPDGSHSWLIPPSGKFGFFLFFGLFWISITAVLSGAFFFGSKNSSDSSGPLGGLLLVLFFSVFWAIGIGVLYMAIRQKYASHMVTVSSETVTLRRKLFNRIHSKSLQKADVTSVALVSFYEQNDTPVYGIEILAGKTGKIRFGSAFNDEEKSWLAADLKRAILGATSLSPSALSPELRAAHRQEVFSIPFPSTSGGMIPLGIFMIAFGAVFLSVACFTDHGSCAPRENLTFAASAFDWGMRIFSNSFNLIFGGFGLATMLAGLAVIRHRIVTRNQERRIEGDSSQIAIRTYQHSRLIKERAFPRSEVMDLRLTHSGHVNNRPMVRIDLMVSGKAERLANWIPGETATVWADQVRLAMGSFQSDG